MGSVCLGLCFCVFELHLTKKKYLTHNVPQAVPLWVIEVQCLGVVGFKMGGGSVFGLDVDGVYVTGSGVPLCSSQDDLLLEPFHLQRKSKVTNADAQTFVWCAAYIGGFICLQQVHNNCALQ